MTNLASVNDVNSLWKPLSHAEQEQVEALLPVVSDSLRQEAKRVGKDLDEMIAKGEILPNVVKSVVVDIISRYLDQLSSENASTLSQESQSALGYSWSGTYVNTGGGMSILKKDLKRLGLTRQRFGMVDLYGIH
ncbi:phage Gp19/Gp15/Gp42 family protein [uncultured Solobacterium sp.]|uniref:phage Gp19/Gp15/Gp42 family protein n=1 Tax=uncultured Solobacterium sp. TaxID=747375 RepID=UPI0028DB261D|nr:phage Gp19/Gp15/Gp42 family protein [uncultured Solobacterium sp.]